MDNKDLDKEEREAIERHYLLKAYSITSEGGEPLDNDPDLIDDNRLPSFENEELGGVDYFILKGEMKRYKSKTGIYKGLPCTWVLQVTHKGFEALRDKKYLKEADEVTHKKTQLQLAQLQIREIKTKITYAILGALGTAVLAFILERIEKMF